MKRGFSLIELLVVVSIISMLAAVLIPNLQAVRQKARDTQRKNDLKQLQKVLESYRQSQNLVAYPTVAPGTTLLGSCGTPLTDNTGNVLINKMPCDPLNITPTPYYYLPDNNALTFTLGACLENNADPEGVDCGVMPCSYNASNNKCYMVNEP